MGVGAPNLCRDGRKTMCAIILSEQMGLIRVYPIDGSAYFPLWANVDLEIETSPGDARRESYRLLSFDVGKRMDDADMKRDLLEACVLKSGNQDPIAYQNSRRKSIALVRMEWGDLEATLSQRVPEVPRDDEECGWVTTQGMHWNKPYLSWTSLQGGTHKTHLVGREIYEGLRHNPQTAWRIFENVRVSDPEWDVWLLLGNMKTRPNVWVCPHVHRLKRKAAGYTPGIFPSRDDAWPYQEQEGVNTVKPENQYSLALL